MKNKIVSIFRTIGRLFGMDLLDKLIQIDINLKASLFERIKADRKYDNPKCLIRYGWKSYSQNEEDGIIHEIFNRIGVTNKIFVEFGVGNGLENNTLTLLFQGWKGLWIEGNKKNFKKITGGFKKTIAKGDLRVENQFITIKSINKIIARNIYVKEIDFLSIDVDGNDVHIFDAINVISPRVVVIEYNGHFPPPIKYCMEYDEKHIWDGTNNFGASLKYIEEIFVQKGYSLIACNIIGVNAFFIKTELTKDLFLKPYSSEAHFEPFRLSIGKIVYNHTPSYKSLENSKSV